MSISTENGKVKIGDVLSIFGTEAQHADARAFSTFMSHLKEIDEHYSTVIMVQVENEVGLLGDSRDRSSLANAAWEQPVPLQLMEAIKSYWQDMNEPFRTNFSAMRTTNVEAIKTWGDIPAKQYHVDELFMAYHYALYVNQVVSAGRAAYALPLYTNVWQNYAGDDRDLNAPTVVAGGGKPGDYPSGGGVTNVLDVWQILHLP